ncbi:MAG: YjjG family noncanonical pyrimidine nucleotidase [Sphingobacteriales bacterium]|nr:YjjG family noncanonical pyrimidine nucleotidase [Sphingobacteriales bacterium]
MYYTDLFFDLDHTLWDFDANARETLLELYDTYRLTELGIDSAEKFIEVYTDHNHRLWRDYHNGLISKEQLRSSRFRLTFEHFELPEHLIPHQFEDDYVSICPTKTNLFEGTHEVLSALKTNYKLHIITNGFLESQEMKMSRTNLKQYFDQVFISEVIGLYKPDIALFNHALEAVGAESHQVLMIGDSLEADILGAKNAGIDQVYFNPLSDPHNYEITYEINKLHELLALLK